MHTETVETYYHHPFRAVESLALAREAAALDAESERKTAALLFLMKAEYTKYRYGKV